MNANELRPGEWYWCDDPTVMSNVQFIQLDEFRPNWAYVEWTFDNDIKGGWFTHVSNLHPLEESEN